MEPNQAEIVSQPQFGPVSCLDVYAEYATVRG
ncbi:MAG: hypothetical protein QOJ19_1785 [Acidimicrobiia bacterium]|jgi:hypothetical protein|nr:hypothetical protein [Acidimicrobiia bacterium]